MNQDPKSSGHFPVVARARAGCDTGDRVNTSACVNRKRRITDARRVIAAAIVMIMVSLMLYSGKGIPMSVQTFAIVMSTVVGAAVLLSGCVAEESPLAGIITEPTRLAIGRPAPDFPITTADGKETTFGGLRKPIAIVAFVSPRGAQCCWLDPDLVSLAGELRHRKITVAQISEPTGKCPHGAGCVAACNMEDPHLVSLCDADRIAWNAYRRPEPDTVVLVDERGDVVAVGRTTDLKAVTGKAKYLAGRVAAFEQSAYQN